MDRKRHAQKSCTRKMFRNKKRSTKETHHIDLQKRPAKEIHKGVAYKRRIKITRDPQNRPI